jgi:hypothetical protein
MMEGSQIAAYAFFCDGGIRKTNHLVAVEDISQVVLIVLELCIKWFG